MADTIQMVLDCREHALIELANTRGLAFESKQLDLGDVHLVQGDQLVCVIERKTYADLRSSIVDGRFREQRDRMKCNVGVDKMVYIIENAPTFYAEWDAKCTTSVFHLLHRDGIKVARTASVSDTLTYMVALLERMNKEPERYVTSRAASAAAGDEQSYTEHLEASMVSKKKGANMTASTVFRSMLSSIPGISSTIAKAMESKASTMRQLMVDLEALDGMAPRKAHLMSIDKIGAGKAVAILTHLGFC